MIKNGTGAWTLSGANTYTGGTTLNGGTLQLGSSSIGSITSGPVGAGGNIEWRSVILGLNNGPRHCECDHLSGASVWVTPPTTEC